MKKIFLILSASLFFIQPGAAQDKTEKIKLVRNEKLLESVDLGDHGLLIKTGKDYMNSKKLDWKIRYYGPEMDLVYEVPIEKTQINKGFSNPIVAAPDGSYVYHIENKGYNTTIGSGKQFLTQISKNGKINTHELEGKKELGRLKTSFCDENFLYFLATEKGDEFHKVKKADEKLLLNKVSNSDFSFQQTEMKLPKLKDPEFSTFWTYAGHEEGALFLSSKNIHFEEGKIVFRLLKAGADGNVVKDVSMEVPLEGKHIRPSNNEKGHKGNYIFDDDDFSAEHTPGSASVFMRHNQGAFGNIKVDEKNNSILIYGLYGSKPFKKSGSLYEGFFLYKYNFDGDLVWKIRQDFTGELAGDNSFRLHAVPYSRNVLLNVNADQSQQLHVYYKTSVVTFEVSSSGELKEAYQHEFDDYAGVNEVNSCFSPSMVVKSRDYLKAPDKKKEKNTFYSYYISAKGESVVEYNPRKLTLDLLYFRNPK